MDASAGAGSGNAPGTGASSCCYYALLGIRKNASSTDIRSAYRRLAMVHVHPVLCFSKAFPFIGFDLVGGGTGVLIRCCGAEVASGSVGERPRRDGRGQAAVPADPGGVLR